MIVKILSADRRSSVGIGIIAPTVNTRVWNIQREEITEPVDGIHCPSVFAVSIESINGHDTRIKS